MNVLHCHRPKAMKPTDHRKEAKNSISKQNLLLIKLIVSCN